MKIRVTIKNNKYCKRSNNNKTTRVQQDNFIDFNVVHKKPDVQFKKKERKKIKEDYKMKNKKRTNNSKNKKSNFGDGNVDLVPYNTNSTGMHIYICVCV